MRARFRAFHTAQTFWHTVRFAVRSNADNPLALGSGSSCVSGDQMAGPATPLELASLFASAMSVADERSDMDRFLFEHSQRYDFSGPPYDAVFHRLVSARFLSHEDTWEETQPRDYRLRVLQCMRVLMRDPAHQAHFADLGGVQVPLLCTHLSRPDLASPGSSLALVSSLPTAVHAFLGAGACPALRQPLEGALRAVTRRVRL